MGFLLAARCALLCPRVRYCIIAGRSGAFGPARRGSCLLGGDADLARTGRFLSLSAAARSSGVRREKRSFLYGFTPLGLSGFCSRTVGVLLGRVGAGGSSVS